MNPAVVEPNPAVVEPNPAVVFWMLEGPHVLGYVDASAPAAGGHRRVATRLSAEAMWLLLEGPATRVDPPVDRAA